MFESSVNSEGIETRFIGVIIREVFESSVNSEGIETKLPALNVQVGLRAV